MLLHKVVINQNVVYVFDHKIIKPFLENVIHECAKCGECIGESKMHKNHTLCGKRSSLHPFYNLNLVIS
jgi:hypothetical protein